MADFLIPDLDEALIGRLELRAKLLNLSLEETVRRILTEAEPKKKSRKKQGSGNKAQR
jgi:hypothetical protein